MSSIWLQRSGALAFVILTGCGNDAGTGGSGGSSSRGGTTGSSGGKANTANGGSSSTSGGTSTTSGGTSTTNGGTSTTNGGASNGGTASPGGATARGGGTSAQAGGGSSSGGASNTGGGSGGNGGASGNTGGNANTGGKANSGGNANTGGSTCAPGTASTITNVMKGTVTSGTAVRLTSVVATSPKFLLSKGNAGACLWAVFVSEPITQAVEYSGALIVTTGTRATVSTSGVVGDCPKGSDPIPDDTKLGDSLSISGTVSSYVRSDCATTTTPPPSTEVRINACSVQRDGTGKTVPLPANITNVDELTNLGTEAAHRKWTGVLVKLTNLSAVDVTGTGPVNSTGTIRFSNGVRTRDRIYQPATAVFGLSTTFASVLGLLHLDVCQWSIEPRSPCTDFTPKSMNCP